MPTLLAILGSEPLYYLALRSLEVISLDSIESMLPSEKGYLLAPL